VGVTSANISVRVQARARKDELVAVREGVAVVRVAAPALDGRANQALSRLIGKLLDVRPASVTIVRGQHSRDKLLRIEGIDQAAVDAALGSS
jgi:uncharacterized protein (TIGR00251 family)